MTAVCLAGAGFAAIRPAEACFAAGFFAAGTFTPGFFAGRFFAAGFFAAGTFTPGFFAAGFFAAGFFAAGAFAAGFFAGGFFDAGNALAAVFLPTGFSVPGLLVADFSAAGLAAVTLPAGATAFFLTEGTIFLAAEALVAATVFVTALETIAFDTVSLFDGKHPRARKKQQLPRTNLPLYQAKPCFV